MNSRRLNRIPLIPCELAGPQECGETNAECCINVDVVVGEEMGAELCRDAEEDVLREWETCPIGVLVVDSFGAFEDFVDEGELDFRELVLAMVVFDCAE